MPDAYLPNAACGRDCGDCHACCVFLTIDAGNVGPGAKPPGVDCPNYKRSGCRIYQQRPQVCAEFACRWLAEADWPSQWRPDLSGLLCLEKKAEGGLPAAVILEMRQDAWAQPTAALILAQVKRTTAVLVAVDSQFQRTSIWGDLAAHAPQPVTRHYNSRQMSSGWQERAELGSPAAAQYTCDVTW